MNECSTHTARRLSDAELAELDPAERRAVLAMREAFEPVARRAAEAHAAGYRSEGRRVRYLGRRCGDEPGAR